MRRNKGKITILSSLLLTIFAWYWCSATLFSHEHFVDGEKIVHSHPLAGSSHTHTSSQLQTISFLTMFLALAAISFAAFCPIEGFKSEIVSKPSKRIVSTIQLASSLRAPPASLL